MRSFNVLITGCSKHSKGIVDCLKQNSDKVSVGVYGCDCNRNNLLQESVDGGFIVPRINDPAYITTLIDICKSQNIEIIFPYITAELPLLSESIDIFEQNHIHVSVARPKTLEIANSKIELAKRFGRYMPSQSVVTTIQELHSFCKEIGYPKRPVCCKIDGGCGGTGFAILDEDKSTDISLFNRVGIPRYISLSELEKIIDTRQVTVIMQEYIEGIDYSVCVLADGRNNLYRQGYYGYSMQYGAVINGEIGDCFDAYRISDEVTASICLEGNACFDFMVSKDMAYLLEVNPRINASLPFVAAAGLNLPYLRCKQLLGEDISTPASINKNLKMQKYYECKYYV